MAISVQTLAFAKKYTDDSIEGTAGVIAGKNCTIDSITDITGGHRITFKWTADGGSSRTSTLDVMDGVDGQNGQNGQNGVDGQDGTDGVSPTVTITDITGGHTVTITDKNGDHSFNVMDGEKGSDGAAGADGNGVKSATIDASNHLILTLDDDTEVDAGAITISVENLTDIAVEDLEDGQILKYNGTTHKWENATAGSVDTNLSDLNDVNLSSLTDGQIIVWDATAGRWKNANNSGSVTVDSELSDSSTNPVQNKVVKGAIDAKADSSSLATVATSGSYTDLSDKPTLGTAASLDVPVSGNATSLEVVKGDDTRLLPEVIKGYYFNNSFYSDSSHQSIVTPSETCIYVDLDTQRVFVYTGSAYKEISSNRSLITELSGSGNAYFKLPTYAASTKSAMKTVVYLITANTNVYLLSIGLYQSGNVISTGVYLYSLRNDYEQKTLEVKYDGATAVFLKATSCNCLRIYDISGRNEFKTDENNSIGKYIGTDNTSYGSTTLSEYYRNLSRTASTFELQTSKLKNSITVEGVSKTTVEDTLSALSTALDSKISISQTAGLVKNDGTIDTNTYALTSALASLQPQTLATPVNINGSNKTTVQQALSSIHRTIVEIPVDADFNDYTANGVYHLMDSGIVYNAPRESDAEGMLIVGGNDDDYIYQFYICGREGFYYRNYRSSTWGQWKPILWSSSYLTCASYSDCNAVIPTDNSQFVTAVVTYSSDSHSPVSNKTTLVVASKMGDYIIQLGYPFNGEIFNVPMYMRYATWSSSQNKWNFVAWAKTLSPIEVDARVSDWANSHIGFNFNLGTDAYKAGGDYVNRLNPTEFYWINTTITLTSEITNYGFISRTINFESGSALDDLLEEFFTTSESYTIEWLNVSIYETQGYEPCKAGLVWTHAPNAPRAQFTGKLELPRMLEGEKIYIRGIAFIEGAS